MKRLIALLLILSGHLPFAQSIKGIVLDKSNNKIIGANVYLENTSFGTETNIDGTFALRVNPGKYKLVASFVGFLTYNKDIIIEQGKDVQLTIKLKENTEVLENVQVQGKTKAQKIKEKAYEVDVVETKALKNSSININNVLKGLSGVNIRRLGGLGSSFEFSINGLSGKQIKFFMDDIPMENLGSSMSLDNFPATLIERAEVYKGVVPIHLGSDALGGAVNIITKQQNTNYLDASYSFGSFNTHIASLMGQYFDNKKGFIAKFSSFYNYSDNNYTIDNVNVLDKQNPTRIIGQIDNLERFHDAYQSNMINFQLGIAEQKIADKLLIGATFSSNTNEIQHNLDFQQPFGEVKTTENLRQVSLTYQNKFLAKKLHTKLYGSVSKQVHKFIDTTNAKYYWTLPRKIDDNNPNGGETSKTRSLRRLDDQLHVINTSLTYKLMKNHQISANYTKSFVERKGDDKFNTIIPFKTPHSVDKYIFGFAYDTEFFNKSWTNSLFLKSSHLQIKGIDINPFDPKKTKQINNNYNKIGFGFASTYKLNNFQVKASFENAVRLPEGYEVFGDGGVLVYPNINLVPEESKNYNLGVLFNSRITNNSRLNINSNVFYRDADKIIVERTRVIKKIYETETDAKIKGVEGNLEFVYNDAWRFMINATKQVVESQSSNGEIYKVANIPFLFGNIKLSYLLNNKFLESDKLLFSLGSRFVDKYEFQSYREGNPEKRNKIPSQLSHNAEVNYSFNQQKYNISLAINNIADSQLFDNFNIQQPGRAFYVKFRYNLNN